MVAPLWRWWIASRASHSKPRPPPPLHTTYIRYTEEIMVWYLPYVKNRYLGNNITYVQSTNYQYPPTPTNATTKINKRYNIQA